jgi:hypothetical protein
MILGDSINPTIQWNDISINFSFQAGDMNRDGVVNFGDLLLLQMGILGL